MTWLSSVEQASGEKEEQDMKVLHLRMTDWVAGDLRQLIDCFVTMMRSTAVKITTV